MLTIRIKKRKETHFNREGKARYRFLGWNGLEDKGAVADLKVGDPAKPLMKAGLVNGVT